MREDIKNCYECWVFGDDNTDGMHCCILDKKVKWFVDRKLMPKECTVYKKGIEDKK